MSHPKLMPDQKKSPTYQHTEGFTSVPNSVLYKEDGKPEFAYVYAKTEKELKAKVEEVKLRIRQGEKPTPDKTTVRQLIEEFTKTDLPNMPLNTADFYTYRMKDIEAGLGHVRVIDLSPLHIERFLNSLRQKGLAEKTVYHTFGTLRTLLNRGADWGMAPDRNPCKKVKAPSKKTTEKPNPFTPEELAQVLNAAGENWMHTFTLVAAWTGLREGELLGLTWSDIDWENGWLRVERSLKRVSKGKGGRDLGKPKTEESERDIPISDLVLQELRQHRKRQMEQQLQAGSKWTDLNLIFTNRHGGFVDPSNLRNRYWYPLLEKAGVRRIVVHGCRHTFATLMLVHLAADVKTVQSLLGHTDIRTTAQYLTGRKEEKKTAINRLDSLLTANNKSELSA